MEASLIQFGTTLALGGFFILIIWEIGKLFRLWNNELIEEQGKFNGIFISSIIVISLVVGIVIEDWSDPFFSSQLFGDKVSKKENVWRKDIFLKEGFCQKYENRGLIKTTCYEEAREQYFYMKNRVYKEPTYYQELTKIEDKIHLSKSLMFISVLIIILVIVLYCYTVFKKPIPRNINNYTFLILVLSIVSFILMFGIYKAEHQADIKRVFGYGITIFDIENKQWGSQLNCLSNKEL